MSPYRTPAPPLKMPPPPRLEDGYGIGDYLWRLTVCIGAGVLVGVAVMVGASCAGGPEQAARVAVAVVEAIPAIDAAGLAAYERELTACPDEACAARVDAAWAPYIEGMQKIRAAVCAAEPAKPGCAK